jgi:Short C-terminal domain/Phospholipase_D-nuclease N-terminal
VPLLDLFWTMLWLFLFFAWIWLVVSVIADVFRSRDLSGWAKAFWLLFIIVIPWVGVLVYLIARGDSMAERGVQEAVERERATRQYIQTVASDGGGAPSTADELGKLAALRSSGVITDDEFEAQKAKLLAQA